MSKPAKKTEGTTAGGTAQSGAAAPWQRALWRRCLPFVQARRVPPALILHSEQGFGVTDFARRFADALLCRGEKEPPCGECLTCRLGRRHDNPDFLLVQPEKEEGVLKIAQIRELTDFVQTTAHYDRKVVLMLRAERMNAAAANALLKTLEEPPPYAVIVLVCHFPSLLPATIRSRCRKLHFDLPSPEDAVAWLRSESGRDAEQCASHLRAAAGMPLAALESLTAGSDAPAERAVFLGAVDEFLAGRATLVQLSADWEKTSAVKVQRWLLEKVEAEIRRAFAGQTKRSTELLFKLYEKQKQRCRPHAAQLTPRLLLESALYELNYVLRAGA